MAASSRPSTAPPWGPQASWPPTHAFRATSVSLSSGQALRAQDASSARLEFTAHAGRQMSVLQALRGHAWPCSTICWGSRQQQNVRRRAAKLAASGVAGKRCGCCASWHLHALRLCRLGEQMGFSTQGWQVSGRFSGALIALASGGNGTVAKRYD